MQPGQDPYQQDPYHQQPPPPPGSYPPPPDQGWYPPQYYAPAAPQNTQGLVGMILGIVALVLLPCCSFLGLPFAIAAVVLGYLGLNRVTTGRATNRGQAWAALICGGAALALSLLLVIYALVAGVWDFTTYQNF
ncbi:uncharacterized protein DUF4190 [Krasilnikovia cinnamomea]|uniref:Uncharacterized protein DUF4190 n=1 Tax=Krasilnikovia cinnamomea TaxID=349313 RepID=A0A4Q7ZM60_9ACTN|nr:uncharacterized protein DUF4190 [Krasilnikovia cinnamomea]